jgi:hypothetical protein
MFYQLVIFLSVPDRFAEFFHSKIKNTLNGVRFSDGIYNGQKIEEEPNKNFYGPSIYKRMYAKSKRRI